MSTLFLHPSMQQQRVGGSAHLLPSREIYALAGGRINLRLLYSSRGYMLAIFKDGALLYAVTGTRDGKMAIDGFIFRIAMTHAKNAARSAVQAGQ